MINLLIAKMLPKLPRKLVWLFSRRYIAGSTLDDAITVSRQMNANGCAVTVDLLGEFVTDLSKAQANRDAYIGIVERFTSEGIDGNFSVKPSSMGLLLDEDVCYRHIYDIVERAARNGSFVRIDMEDSACVDKEIALYMRLKNAFANNVGLVLQAYLKRTRNDLQTLKGVAHTTNSPLNFRLCKGIYIEPPAIAHKSKDVIRNEFLWDLEYMFANKIYVCIATHDKALIKGAFTLIERYQVPKHLFEFQMLLGVTPKLRKRIVEMGYRIRIYVPFGQEWFGYSTRRLKENPNMVWHIIKSLLIKQ